MQHMQNILPRAHLPLILLRQLPLRQLALICTLRWRNVEVCPEHDQRHWHRTLPCAVDGAVDWVEMDLEGVFEGFDARHA